ncbi:MAG: S-methyl-5-thioribose kinase [Deltaproteobacteria bacterium]|nr:S-methyl-5-thioribose kinase [Deltaproteobacteria bacterium]
MTNRETPEGYVALDATTVCGFAEPYLPGGVTGSEEIGDGNVNLVFRVRGASRSVIVKQALPWLRCVGRAWPLTLDRARIEAAALKLQDSLVPGSVPALLDFDPVRRAMVLEDLRGHVVLRRGMLKQERYPTAFGSLGAFAARTLLGTSFLVCPASERRELALGFHNPELCAITEELVFTAPFTSAPSNSVRPSLEPAAARLREDRAVARAAAALRHAFRTRAEAIVHGDLHTGSVMVTPTDTRVIDPEFAFPGPMAFDPGKLLGNLALSYLSHEAQGHGAYALWVASQAEVFWEAFADAFRRAWPRREPGREGFLLGLLQASAGYAGACMCRRVVGLAGVADLRELEEGPRLRAEEKALVGGAALLTARPVGSRTDLWELAVGTG